MTVSSYIYINKNFTQEDTFYHFVEDNSMNVHGPQIFAVPVFQFQGMTTGKR